ncbi:C4-type zinc ribbon domain-containing protein [Ignavibacterium sp.]|uniref:zinc ribbon domain-containing protein n=1 Tax=Ignavibacterium sp. TaxID=2651167 RepID=UPI00307DE5B8
MQTRLKILYQLQLIDDQLDELEELRGDLPNTVNALKSQINELRDEIKNKEKGKKESLERRQLNEEEIEKLKESQKKFKAQLYQVRNNKEYDALTKEIDHTEETIKRLEAENDALADKSKTLSAEIEEILPKVEELGKELKENESDLKDIIKANEKEENKLLEERKKVEALVKKPDLVTYTRIRKAKKGRAVVTIKRSACSGCHNIIPSQRQLEIRRNDRIFTCEYCGRILVSQEIADEVEKSR